MQKRLLRLIYKQYIYNMRLIFVCIPILKNIIFLNKPLFIRFL